MLWAPKGGTMRGGFIASTANKCLAHLAHLFRTPPWHTCFELHMLVLVRTVARWLPVAASYKPLMSLREPICWC